jgi:hypothetical protein
MCIIAKRKFSYENIGYNTNFKNNVKNNFRLFKERNSLNTFQLKQLIFETNNKSLTKTQYISYNYDGFCNKCDNTNIEYEYEESDYFHSKKRKKKTVDESKLRISILKINKNFSLSKI